MNTDACTLIVLRGDSSLVPFLSHDADRLAAGLTLARERGVEVAEDCRVVVLLRGVHDDTQLDADPAVVTYEHVPGDSPALERYVEEVSD